MLSAALVFVRYGVLRIDWSRIHYFDHAMLIYDAVFFYCFQVRPYVDYWKRMFGADARGCGLMRFGRA